MSFKVIFGWIATIAWMLAWAIFLHNDWQSASDMAFNEWGDYFAGISAPLAFMWLVIGYFQQGEELSQNTKALEQQEKALKLQVDELKHSVEQQNRSAVALGIQSKIAGYTARLNATNHVLESLDQQIIRAEKSDNVDATKNVRELTEKQQQYEVLLEKLLKEIDSLEEKQDD